MRALVDTPVITPAAEQVPRRQRVPVALNREAGVMRLAVRRFSNCSKRRFIWQNFGFKSPLPESSGKSLQGLAWIMVGSAHRFRLDIKRRFRVQRPSHIPLSSPFRLFPVFLRQGAAAP